MFKWQLDSYFVVVIFSLSLTLSYSILGLYYISSGDWPITGVNYMLNNYISIQLVSYLLSATTLILWSGIVVCFYSPSSILFISGSAFSAVLCFSSNNSLCFWFFYELSILFLVVKLFQDSPYSERPFACWYFVGYIVFTSLPLVACIVYIGLSLGSFGLIGLESVELSHGMVNCVVIMSVCFIIKMPLFPFHSWLPVVHAESPNVVSVCLSGYVMKLGLYGLYRFSYLVISDLILSPMYTFFVLVSGSIFLFMAQRELDVKRWIAFLSLAHMVCVCYGACIVTSTGEAWPLFHCFNHGLVSAFGFICVWMVQLATSSRNWVVVVGSFLSFGFLNLFLLVLICFESSLPPTVGFFSEMFTLSEGLVFRISLALCNMAYMLFAGIIPFLSLCYAACVSFSYIAEDCSCYRFFVFLLWVGLACFFCFVVLII